MVYATQTLLTSFTSVWLDFFLIFFGKFWVWQAGKPNWYVFHKNTPVFLRLLFYLLFHLNLWLRYSLAASAILSFKTDFRFLDSQVVTSNGGQINTHCSVRRTFPRLTLAWPDANHVDLSDTHYAEMSYTVLHSRTEKFIHSRNFDLIRVNELYIMHSLRNHW